jgi:hypothetical protein
MFIFMQIYDYIYILTYVHIHVEYLSLSDAVYDGLQGLVGVTLEDPLHRAGPACQCLLHAHVQVVVTLLGC